MEARFAHLVACLRHAAWVTLKKSARIIAEVTKDTCPIVEIDGTSVAISIFTNDSVIIYELTYDTRVRGGVVAARMVGPEPGPIIEAAIAMAATEISADYEMFYAPDQKGRRLSVEEDFALGYVAMYTIGPTQATALTKPQEKAVTMLVEKHLVAFVAGEGYIITPVGKDVLRERKVMVRCHIRDHGPGAW